MYYFFGQNRLIENNCLVFRLKGGYLELLENLLALEFLLRKKGFLRNGGTRRLLVPKSVGAGPLWAYFQAQIYKYPMINWHVDCCWSFETNLWNQKCMFFKADIRDVVISLAKFNCFFDGISIGILEELWSHLQLLCHNVWFSKTDTHLLLCTIANVYPFFWIRLYSFSFFQLLQLEFCRWVQYSRIPHGIGLLLIFTTIKPG